MTRQSLSHSVRFQCGLTLYITGINNCSNWFYKLFWYCFSLIFFHQSALKWAGIFVFLSYVNNIGCFFHRRWLYFLSPISGFLTSAQATAASAPLVHSRFGKCRSTSWTDARTSLSTRPWPDVQSYLHAETWTQSSSLTTFSKTTFADITRPAKLHSRLPWMLRGWPRIADTSTSSRTGWTQSSRNTRTSTLWRTPRLFTGSSHPSAWNSWTSLALGEIRFAGLKAYPLVSCPTSARCRQSCCRGRSTVYTLVWSVPSTTHGCGILPEKEKDFKIFNFLRF